MAEEAAFLKTVFRPAPRHGTRFSFIDMALYVLVQYLQNEREGKR